jgi:hypothetical protein
MESKSINTASIKSQLFSSDQNDNISYEEEFEELRCIGRGNFGAAFLVKLRNAPDG